MRRNWILVPVHLEVHHQAVHQQEVCQLDKHSSRANADSNHSLHDHNLQGLGR